ncbi:V-type proton ATPase subunit G 2-like [Petromyzon marinus]|uniref:V-type proton ATPase subunit G n=2 Tax=Petromyzon marinus TaxID=7757 RepID=A0AAJ7TTW4_PETMA|nr:V-type proton ATPase subunit G 2-like [Petromyzon marinus]
MASQSQGIQQLLHAEKRAAERVAEARKRKARRLRQAKEEAQAEIEQYRQQRDAEFRGKQDTVLGSQGDVSARIQEETRGRVHAMHARQREARDPVLRRLLTIVWDVRPEIHANYRG